jgi:glucose-6-phosphate 1-dehydrogenase
VSLAEPSLTPIRTVDGYLPLEGDCVLSIRGDEAEEIWRVVEPVLAAWREQRVPPLE